MNKLSRLIIICFIFLTLAGYSQVNTTVVKSKEVQSIGGKDYYIHTIVQGNTLFSLSKVYEILHKSSKRYICVAEYYNPSPVEVNYRGHQGKLFKRDFAGEIIDKFKDVCLVDYGFVYHRDPYPQDDINWFLLEKK